MALLVNLGQGVGLLRVRACGFTCQPGAGCWVIEGKACGFTCQPGVGCWVIEGKGLWLYLSAWGRVLGY